MLSMFKNWFSQFRHQEDKYEYDRGYAYAAMQLVRYSRYALNELEPMRDTFPVYAQCTRFEQGIIDAMDDWGDPTMDTRQS